MSMTRRSTPGLSGPRSTRSPRKMARRPSGLAPSAAVRRVAEQVQQLRQLVQAAMHVADDVERPGLAPAVGEQRLADQIGLRNRFRRGQGMDDAEALPRQAAQRATQQLDMAAHHMGAEGPVRMRPVALLAYRLWNIQHDRHRQRVEAPRQLHCLLAVLRAQVGRVDHGQPPGREALGGDVVEHVERVGGGRLVGLVVGHQAAAAVGGQDLGGPEVPRREGGFAGAGRAHHQHQREVGDRQPHRNTAIAWDGPVRGAARRRRTARRGSRTSPRPRPPRRRTRPGSTQSGGRDGAASRPPRPGRSRSSLGWAW